MTGLRRLIPASLLSIALLLPAGCNKTELPEFVPPGKEEKDPEQKPDDKPDDKPESDNKTLVISTAADFGNFATDYNNGKYDRAEYDSLTVCLGADISLKSTTSGFKGIGTAEKPFRHTFNGKGHSITDITFATPLFPYMSGLVDSLSVKGAVALPQSSGTNYGMIAGVLSGTVSNCSVQTSVSLKSTTALEEIYVGSIAGKIEPGKSSPAGVYECTASGKIDCESSSSTACKNWHAGGIAGKASGSCRIAGCSSGTNITVHINETKANGTYNTTGGILGYFDGEQITISDCVAHFDNLTNYNFNNSLTAGAGTFNGGIAGLLVGSGRCSVSNCSATGPMYCKRGMLGGMVGRASNVDFKQCTSTCSTASNNIGHYNGGIVGYAENCYISGCNVKTGSIFSTTNTSSGGIAGTIDGKTMVTANAFYGTINPTGGVVGAIVGTDAAGASIKGNGLGGKIGTAAITLANVSGTSAASISDNYLIGADFMDGAITVNGYVRDDSGNPVSGVVVSDGQHCVQTDSKGYYELPANIAKTRFVYYSTPAGYEINHKDFIPQFFIKLEDRTPDANGVYSNTDFTLKRRSAATDDFTLVLIADPQPRASTAGYDNIGYHALECCEDLYRDVSETVKATSGEKLLIALGDIVHENMDLYSNYAAGIAKMGLPSYGVIGNHDTDTHAANDDEGAIPYENWFGPRNYSFNVGKFHFMVIDNIMMTLTASGSLAEDNQKVTDGVWEWMQADLKYVSYDTPVIISAHSPMFKTLTGDKSLSTAHGKDYGALLSKYVKVYSFAGHHHRSYNYVYGDNDTWPHVEQHTMHRSTGALWINENVCSDGVPRGYLVAKGKGKELSWQFKPTKYQSGAPKFVPEYKFRDWDYRNGIAYLRSSGKEVSTDYQMHVYGSNVYGDNYVYANVFYYDNAWKKPVLTYEGKTVEMEQVTDDNRDFDWSYRELSEFYTSKTSKWDEGEGGTNGHLFRAPVSGSAKTASVSVTDRFGNTYTSTVNW